MKIFISSPGDVGEERSLAALVLDRLQKEFAGRVTLEPYFYEHEPLRATDTYQPQIMLPSQTEIALVILWARLGTRLPQNITRSDGSTYASGTEFEFEDAVNGYRRRGVPDLLVYRKSKEPVIKLSNEQEVLERLSQKKALDAFIDKWFRADDGSFTAAFHSFETPAQFEELLERHLRKLISSRLPSQPKVAEVSAIPPAWPESPYRGLEVFDFEHSPIYFGRTRAVSELLEALRHKAGKGCPFVLVLGMSGCGKSSLVRAGLLPRLIKPGVIEGIGIWRRALMRPSDASGDLLHGLAISLMREQAIPELAVSGSEELGQLLRDSPAAVGLLIRAALSQASQQIMSNENLPREPASRLILAVDQLEEIFTLERVTPSERKTFASALKALVLSGSVWAVATLRSDFYARLVEIPALVEIKEGEGQYDLMPPAPAEIGQMIRQPARIAGLQFEENKETDERLDDVLRDAATGNPASLPLLEFTLEELYKGRARDNTLTFDSYRSMGGLEGALARRAEEIFTSLAPEVQAALPTVLSALVAIRADDNFHIAGKRVPLRVATGTAECRKLIEALVTARLFVTDRADDGAEVVGIAHEALLSQWDRVKDWIIRNEDLLRIRSRIAVAARLWEAQGRVRNFLLPAGKALDEGRKLLAALRNVLSPEEVEYIEASAGSAVQKRRRAIAARASLAFAFLLVVGLGLYYWDAFFRVHKEYYTTFAKRWGQFEGIGRLSKEAASHREVSVELVRCGSRGHVEEARLVDGFGKCPTSYGFAYFLDSGPYSFSSQECRQVMEYNGNEVKKQKAYGWTNLPMYELSYVTQNKALISQFGVGLSGRTFSGYVEFTRPLDGQDAGLDRELRLYDLNNFPVPDQMGAYGERHEFRKEINGLMTGLITDVTYLGYTGLPVSRYDGVGRKTLVYDDKGNRTEVSFFDPYMHPAMINNSFARVVFSYENGRLVKGAYFRLAGWDSLDIEMFEGAAWVHDDRGLMREETYLGPDGKPALHPVNGYSKTTWDFDSQGNMTAEAYWGIDGRPAVSKVLLYAAKTLKIQRDAHGTTNVESYKGPDGEPVANNVGYGMVRSVYDTNDDMVEQRYYDVDGNPVGNKDAGCVKETWGYQHRNVVYSACWASDGQLMPFAKLGYAKSVSSYDDDDNMTQQAFQGVDQQPVIIPGQGFSRVLYSYNNGNLVEVAYYGPDGKLVRPDAPPRGPKTTWKFDADGNITEVNYFGADERPTLASMGYARIKREKDGGGYFHARALDTHGNLAWTIVSVEQVSPGGQGETIGLQPGNRIMEYFGQPVHNSMEFSELTMFSRSTVTGVLKVLQNGVPANFKVYPGTLGITVRDDGPRDSQSPLLDQGSGQ